MHHNTVKLDQVFYTYPDGSQALRGISLSIRSDERIGIIGPNGAGKSTLLLMLNGILRPQSGTIHICDLVVNDSNISQIRKSVGLVFQDPNDQLFCPTVFEDVAFAPRYFGIKEEDIKLIVARSLRQVGLNGYENRSSYHLSLGEKKRVAIATVLSMQPDILILDEPSAGLDPGARRSLIQLLQSLPITLLIATHDLLLVHEICTRIILLNHGKIVADGDKTILANTALLQENGLI